jgi:hypothetical protein
MSRLNLTLDGDTLAWLQRHASKAKTGVASLARQLIEEAVEHRESLRRRRKLAADYAAGREDARALLADLEAPQLEGLLDES